MARDNFSWGAAGVGKEGVDYGNTNNWNDQQWQDYDKRYNIPSAPQKIDDGVSGRDVLGTSGGASPTVPGQAAAASTYSGTPGAAPSAATANQGTQDVVRNSWLQQSTQGTQVDLNDPNLKQQIDPFAAAQERSRREAENASAERLSAQGLGNSGQIENERRYATERAGQATGAFQSQLVGHELENRRSEIKDALTNLGGMISNDQKLALQKQLADLDAAIKREGISAGLTTSGNELSLKDKLGTGALNVDLMRALLQNQQFGDSQALDWSKFDWQTNPMNPTNY